MAPPSSRTYYFDDLLTSTLDKWMDKNAVNQVGTSNVLLYKLMGNPRTYRPVDSLGEMASISLRYQLGQPDSYSDYDVLNNKPISPLTKAFYPWAGAADSVMISGQEQRKNAGEQQALNLLEERKDAIMDGFKEWFGKCLLQGLGALGGGGSVATQYVSPNNGSTFIQPLFYLVALDPTAIATIGNIPQATNDWWQNVSITSTATTYEGFFTECDKLEMDCGKGTGGNPDLYLTDENVFRFYKRAHRAYYQNVQMERADIPFRNVLLHGQPLVWDQFMPDVAGDSVTLDEESGTIAALNTKFFRIEVHRDANFTPSPFVTPTNQDAKVSNILWNGQLLMSKRSKQGLLHTIDTTIAS